MLPPTGIPGPSVVRRIFRAVDPTLPAPLVGFQFALCVRLNLANTGRLGRRRDAGCSPTPAKSLLLGRDGNALNVAMRAIATMTRSVNKVSRVMPYLFR